MAKTKRVGISTRTRFEVFKRDEFVCQYCGSNPPSVVLHVDHITPVSKNGTNDIDNLITSCSKCNMGKSNVLLSSTPKSLKDKAKEIEEREKQIKGYADIISSKRERIESEAWKIATLLNESAHLGFDRLWFTSIKTFLNKLQFHEVYDSMEIAISSMKYQGQAFKYFCGICWNKIKNNDTNG